MKRNPDPQQTSIGNFPRVITLNIPKFQKRLLKWYARYGRDLPWRKTQDPYKILVSEIMLHQTQVDRVVPKYLEFLERYPDFSTLAQAPQEEVVQLWYPLGYNFRPIRLREIAQEVVSKYGGNLPTSVEELMKFRGIGRYTAGAIMNFAFHRDAPIMDTNVERLLKRIFINNQDSKNPNSKRHLWHLAAAVVPPGRGYIFNQALMDFGALVCTARRHDCQKCPMKGICIEYLSNKKLV